MPVFFNGINDMNESIERQIQNAVHERDASVLRSILFAEHPSDIAEVLSEMEGEEAIFLFEAMDAESAGDVLEESDEETQQEIVESGHKNFVLKVLNDLPPDVAADILGKMSDEERNAFLSEMETESAYNVKRLLKYREDTAGGIMTTEYICLESNLTAREAIEKTQSEFDQVEEHVSHIFVLENDKKLKGLLPVNKLVFARPETRIYDLMEKKYQFVTPDMDREEVANEFRKYNLISLPVCDRYLHLLGMITVDDIMDVVQAESSEDMFMMAGTSERAADIDSPVRRAFLRFPWLLITLVGGLLCSLVMRAHDVTLTEIVALTFFIPVIIGMAGNISIQSSTVIVRGLATGEIDISDFFSVIGKELLSGLILGIICGFLTGIAGVFFNLSIFFGIALGVSMFAAILIASLTGTFIPLLCHALKIDPAIAAGPFVTTLNDVVGLLVYLSIASSLTIYFHT